VSDPRGPIDPELEALPEPRRPFRRLTLATMSVTAGLALTTVFGLRSSAAFALELGPPREVGALTAVQLGGSLANSWVHGTGTLAGEGVEYRRPLDGDRYRLVQIDGNPRLFVELRVPAGVEPAHYVAPNSFVGRLVPLENAGIRYHAVSDALSRTLAGAAHSTADDAWVLVDGQAPSTSRWALALGALFIVFAAANVWGIVRLLKPVSQAAHAAQ
jgi:hypothetical protein